MPKWCVRLIVTLAAMFALAGCGYQGTFRYPCQNPANWEKAECNPPICTATGTCTDDVLPNRDKGATIEDNTTTGATDNG